MTEMMTGTRERTLRARGEPTKKKKIGRHAKNKRVSGAERRATHSVRRKPTAPDMSKYRRNARSFTKEQVIEAKGTVVRSLAMHGNLRQATDSAGIRRALAYEWRKKDPVFAAAWDDAVEEAHDRIEEEMWRRGIDGFARPVIYKGKITDQYTDYSDSLLQTLARGNRPNKFKDRTEHSTPPGAPMQLNVETKGDVIASILGMIKSKPDPT